MVKILNDSDKASIIEAIRLAESGTSGEIRVHLRKKCGQDSLKEAKKVFRHLGMHRTKEKNGVLLFIAQDSHQFAIIGDEGIHDRVGDSFWGETRDQLAKSFSQGQFHQGILDAVRQIGEKLQRYFPIRNDDKNELSNTVTQD